MSNVDTMPAGREMDALVAERVMGWYRVGAMWCKGANSFAAQAEEVAGCPKIWTPSTDIAAAWEVVEKLREKAWVSVTSGKTGNPCYCEVDVVGGEIWHVTADTAPLAICRAALKLCEVK